MPDVTKLVGGEILMSQGGSDVVVEWSTDWVLDDLSLLFFSVLGLFASSGRADWVRSHFHIGSSLGESSELPSVTKLGFSISHVLLGGSHVSVKLWGEVVVHVLGWVGPFGLGGGSSHDQLVGKSAL